MGDIASSAGGSGGRRGLWRMRLGCRLIMQLRLGWGLSVCGLVCQLCVLLGLGPSLHSWSRSNGDVWLARRNRGFCTHLGKDTGWSHAGCWELGFKAHLRVDDRVVRFEGSKVCARDCGARSTRQDRQIDKRTAIRDIRDVTFVDIFWYITSLPYSNSICFVELDYLYVTNNST